ncbi:Aerobic respiration control sensor protein ArcB [Pirellulimonas nuda]|uniref:histidine kinase n=1 Tax=Pirellulimonas nuda TaxID=2528009 RepID=A0A518DDY0_9BACT|nr:PAS domain S-box protein [Pirellulimonas nuda]QDU89666.1 Aerobic respiration control sensor protein ArcB [Pirellulimonas nuda]
MPAFWKRILGRSGPTASTTRSLHAAQAGQDRAENQLRRSEDQLTQLVAGVRDYAIFLLDREGTVVTWNAGAERIKGYRADEIIGQHFSRFYPQESISADWPAHELAVAAETGRFEDEGWRVRKDGTRFWANVVITALQDGQGPHGFLKITRDLTDRRQAEEELRISEERLRLMIESVQDYAIFMLDPDGLITTWNSGAARIKGYAAHEIIGEHFSRFYPEEARQRDWPGEELRRAQAAGRIEDEGWRVRKDGSRFWANVVITALRDESGALCGFCKVTRDLTERLQSEENARKLLQEEAARAAAEAATAEAHRAREAERQQRAQWQVTLSSIGDAVIVTDADGAVSFMNAVAASLTGWDLANAKGRPLEEVFRIVNEHTRHPVENPVAKVLREGTVVGLANSTVLIGADGREAPIDDSGAPIRGEDGAITGVVLVFRDDTERRCALEVLRAADRRKNEFLATLAHELRNPLAPIRTGLELMRSRKYEPATLDEVLPVVERQTEQLVSLVDDLLDVSRVTRGLFRLRRRPSRLSGLVQAAVEAARPFIDGFGHELGVDLPPEEVVLDVDPNRLSQVLTNLLNNAAKYTPQGGHIWLSARVEAQDVLFTVRDTGLGIPAEDLERIFEMFTRIEHHEQEYAGLGVGLTLSKQLVELHGGVIEVTSEGQGKGTEFRVRIPAVTTAEPAAAEPAAATPATPTPQLRVLVVDDNRAAAFMLTRLIERMGNEVRSVGDGVAAVQSAAEFCPDIVLMDLLMPRMGGCEAARQIRSQTWGASMTLVAVTGCGLEEDRQMTIDAGFDDHLVKPVSVDALEALFARHATPR